MLKPARMEQFGGAFVRLIAAQAGCNVAKPEVDDDSVDLELSMTGLDDCLHSRAWLALQLKSRSGIKASGGEFACNLSVKNYNNLRAEVVIPRLLVVVHLPENPDDWLWQTRECACASHCAYWLSLKDYPDTTNRETINVHLPCENVFSKDFLINAMRKMANNQPL